MKVFFSIFLVVFSIIGCDMTSTDFTPCGGKLYPYYWPTLSYEGEFYAIKKHFVDNYKVVNAGQNTGIVKIRFHVNCKGESGNYKVETYSLDYKPIEIDNQVSEQLLTLTKGLKKWIPAKTDKGDLVDSHKFLAFKVVNGQIIEFLPK